MILLLLACVPAGPDPSLACAVFDAASQDLVSPEHDAVLEQGLVELAQTAGRVDLTPALRAELDQRYRQLATFAQQRSQQRAERVDRLIRATQAAFPSAPIQAEAVAPGAHAPGPPGRVQELVQQLAHERGRQRRKISAIEALCHPPPS